MSDLTDYDILYNPTHFPDPLGMSIRQVPTSCTIQHISLIPLVCRIWQVMTSCTIQRISPIPLVCRLDRFWHPVQSNTFPRSPWYVGLDTFQCIFFCVMDVAYHFHICSPNGVLIHTSHAFSIYYILGRIWYDSLQTSSYLVRSGLIFLRRI